MSGRDRRRAGAMPVTRRRLLQFGLAVLPGLLGAKLLSRWVPGLGEDAALGTSGQPPTGTLPSGPPSGRTGHDWAFVCDTTRCVGCGLCVEACKLENGVPLDPECNRTWVERHVVTDDGSLFIDSPEGGIHGFPAQSTAVGAVGRTVRQSFFVPRLCMQCENPPCVSVCPVSATYQTEDGVILVDADRCLGCGYCLVACPYGARYLVPSGGETPAGTPGVADKCTWCYHRISNGRSPACVEVCPMGARAFGDLNDPESRVSTVLREQRAQVLKPALGTQPRVYYLGLEAEVE